MLRFLYTEKVSPLGVTRSGANIVRYLSLYELSNKYDIPYLAGSMANLIHNFIENSSKGVWNFLCLRVARMLYCDLSHDGHFLRQNFLERLSEDTDPCLDLMEFARENHEFAGETHL